MPTPKKSRLDTLLVARGLVETREKARALIMAGQVDVDGHGAAKAGTMVAIAVGGSSQWGRVRAKLVKEEVNTPLQDKLDSLAEQIG